MELPIFLALMSVTVINFVWLMLTFRKTAFYSVSVCSILIFVFADKESLNLFFIAKVVSVIFPIILFAYLQAFKQKAEVNQLFIGIMELIIIVNILEAAIYSLSYSDFPVFMMGLCLVVSMPNFEMNENNLLGFKDPIWSLGYTLTLILGFIRFDGHTEYIIPGILILSLGMIIPAITKKWFEWLNFRVYSLYLILTLDLIFRDGEIGLYEFLMPGLIQNTELDTTINIIATSLCMITCITLVARKVRVSKPIILED